MLPFSTQLFQLRGSTVTFTNRSVKTENVTGWSWQLDSGSGFEEVATTQNANITFPDVAGVTCVVRLVASGPWGDDIVYERSYMLADNVPAPVITAASSMTAVCDIWLENSVSVQAGTGAGDLTWEIAGGQCPGVLIETSTGRIFGIPETPGTYVIAVSVTDSLSRTAVKDITFSVATQITNTISAQRVSSITKDALEKVSRIDCLQYPAYYYSQATSTKMPTFGNDGSHNYIEFSEDTHTLARAAGGFNSTQGIVAVVDIISKPVTGYQALISDAANYDTGRRALWVSPVGMWLLNTATTPTPSGSTGKIIVCVPQVNQSSGSVRRLFINGTPAGNLVPYVNSISDHVALAYLGNITGTYTKYSARFRLYKMFGVTDASLTTTALLAARYNEFLYALSREFNIPAVRQIQASDFV